MSYSRLLNCLWRAGAFSGQKFVGLAGEEVAVTDTGEPSEWEPGVWMAAEVTIDGERRRGPVAVGERTPVPDGAVLRVVCNNVPPVLGTNDLLVTQICSRVPSVVIRCYEDLRAGAGSHGCAARIAQMLPVYRTSFYTALLVERLKRKTEHIREVFDVTEQDWNQTFHLLMLRAMGGDRNREAFAMLAAKVTAAMVSREKSSSLRVEALLLGGAGFLFDGGHGHGGVGGSDRDEYTLRLEEEARHLFAKYSIVPLKSAAWDLSRLYPANHPAVRLAQIAALVCKKDFILDGVLQCRSSEDVERLFAATASDYWRTHYKPSGAPSTPSAKSIGRAKARLLAINLAAPLMFAYGRQTGAEELCERALDLLTSVPPERNRLLEGWYEGGCTAENGFESQALLQLTREYCSVGACADCRMGRAEIKSALARSTSTIKA